MPPGKKVRGRPFPKGVSGNPGGKRKVDPEVIDALHAGNMEQLKRLWRLSQSKNERIALTAVLAWLLKTLPNAEKLELSGPGGAPIVVANVRDQLEARLMKLLADDPEPAQPVAEGELAPSAPLELPKGA